MAKLRTFVAVELSSSVTAKAVKLIERLRATGVEANWVKREDMHLTLKFLGDVRDTETPDVCRVVQAAAATVEPFEVVFRGAGAFPDAQRPRTLWIGVTTGEEELVELQTAVEEGLHSQLGYPKERRRYVPHLTLGRVKHLPDDPQALAAALEQASDYDGDLTTVEEVVTFASFLRDTGPRYEALDHAPLGD
jgi:2'-5' RNA ligase